MNYSACYLHGGMIFYSHQIRKNIPSPSIDGQQPQSLDIVLFGYHVPSFMM